LAREQGVDLNRVAGSGSHGRITPEDVQAAADQKAEEGSLAPALVPGAPGEPGQDAWGPIRREKLSQIRKTIAQHMTQSATTIPRVTNFDDADVTDLEQMRKGVPPDWLGANLKLTTMPFVMKAVAVALRRHPVLNASLDEEQGQIVYKQYVHLGVAVDTPRGLVVPVMRNVDRMTIPEIARALVTLAQRARTAQFALEELRGNTFTLTNLGAVGGTYSTPIINQPDVAILLVGRSRWLPMVREGRIEPRLMMPLSLSYDHRVVDGAAAARFLNEVIGYLQSPAKLVLG
jgi:pyruvate dehydrogenase E2 component (dihydrolipoamide acetyltransferase)